MTTTGLLRFLPALVFSATLVHAGQNLALNPSFENIGPLGDDTSYGPAASPPDFPSAAADWMIWNSQVGLATGPQGTTSTERCANSSIDPLCAPSVGSQPLAIDGLFTLHVTTNIGNAGVYQAFLPSGGPANVNWSVWIYVVTGQVDAAVGNGGGTHPDLPNQFTTSSGKWEQLVSQNTPANSPANEITIYSVNRAAEFYLDAVDIEAPEPGTLLGAASALLLLAGYGLRRR